MPAHLEDFWCAVKPLAKVAAEHTFFCGEALSALVQFSCDLLTQILFIVENVRIFAQGFTKASRIAAAFFDVFFGKGSAVAKATNANIEKVFVN